MLRWSDDGGHTWSNSHWRSMGKTGTYGTRVIWRRLGMTLKLRDRVYEVSGTDPIKIAIMGAELIASPTNGRPPEHHQNPRASRAVGGRAHGFDLA
jgi:hypothetical protein